MNWFERFINALKFEIEEPPLFGWYHLLSFAVVIALSALVIVFRKKITRRFINVSMLAVGIVLIISEIFKQTLHSFDVENGLAVWEFSWRTFPFQFCSVPMYLFTLAGILKKGKAYDAITCFLATFSLFGGIAVMSYPSTVLSSVLFYSVHTMVWHGSMVIIAVMLLSTKTVELSFKSVWKACIIFAIALAIAEAMNFAWRIFGNPDKTFSMFYISPYYKCDIPVLNVIKDKTPYIVFILGYIVGFTSIACLVMGVAIGIDKLYQTKSNKKAG